MAKKVVDVREATMDQILAGEEISVAESEPTSEPAAASQGGAPAGDAPPAEPKPAEPAAAGAPSSPAAAPAAAAAPPAQAAPAAEADDDEPEPDYAWIESLPPAQLREKMRQTLHGLRSSMGRRTAKIKKLESELEGAHGERRSAIQVALQRSDELTRFKAEHAPKAPGAPGTPAGAAPPAEQTLEFEIGDDGKARIPASALAPIMERAQQPQREAEERALREREHLQACVTETDRVMTAAEIPTDTQQRLGMAFREMSQLLVSAATRAGITPAHNLSGDQERALLRREGVERELQAKYPGVTLEDLYALPAMVRDPWTNRRALESMGRHYAGLWKTPAAAAAPAAPVPKIPEHPGSLARAGGGTVQVESTLDEYMGITPDDVVNGRVSPERLAELETRWRKDMGMRER